MRTRFAAIWLARMETTRRRLKATGDELIRLDERINTQQRDLDALQSCLAGPERCSPYGPWLGTIALPRFSM